MDERPSRDLWIQGYYQQKCEECDKAYKGGLQSRVCADCAYSSPAEQIQELVDSLPQVSEDVAQAALSYGEDSVGPDEGYEGYEGSSCGPQESSLPEHPMVVGRRRLELMNECNRVHGFTDFIEKHPDVKFGTAQGCNLCGIVTEDQYRLQGNYYFICSKCTAGIGRQVKT